MYILVEILHTEFQYISLIEIQKYNWNRKRIEKREIGKNGAFVPVGQARGAGSPFCLGWCFLSRLPDPAWRSRLGKQDKKGFPTGTTLMFCSSESRL